jgi:hypothetical protein
MFSPTPQSRADVGRHLGRGIAADDSAELDGYYRLPCVSSSCKFLLYTADENRIEKSFQASALEPRQRSRGLAYF